MRVEDLEDDIVIGVDEDIGWNINWIEGNLLRRFISIDEGEGGGERVIEEGKDGNKEMIRIKKVESEGKRKSKIDVGEKNNGLKFEKVEVGEKVIGKLKRRENKMVGILLKIGLEEIKKSEGVGGREWKKGDKIEIEDEEKIERIEINEGVEERKM